MSETGSARQSPRAVVHKQILEIAETSPNASIETIAERVSGATPDLVERTLDTYGDPADGHGVQSASTDSTTMSENTKYDSPGLAREEDHTAPQARERRETGDDEAAGEQSRNDSVQQSADAAESDVATPEPPQPEELSDTQRDVLRAISKQPTATQGTLAEQFGVTRATISRWVNDIPGFEWQNREEFVARHLGTEEAASDGGGQSDEVDRQLTDIQHRLDTLEQQLASLHEQGDEFTQHRVADGDGDVFPLAETDLLAKVIRACIDDERITEDEETELIGALLQ